MKLVEVFRLDGGGELARPAFEVVIGHVESVRADSQLQRRGKRPHKLYRLARWKLLGKLLSDLADRRLPLGDETRSKGLGNHGLVGQRRRLILCGSLVDSHPRVVGLVGDGVLNMASA